jgi:hypothetical protein
MRSFSAFLKDDASMLELRAHINSAHIIIMPVAYSRVLAAALKRERYPKYESSYEIIGGLYGHYTLLLRLGLLDPGICAMARAEYETGIAQINVELCATPEPLSVSHLQRYTIRLLNLLEVVVARLIALPNDKINLTVFEDIPVSELQQKSRDALPKSVAFFLSDKQFLMNHYRKLEINVFSDPQVIEQRIRDQGGYLDSITAAEYFQFLNLIKGSEKKL